MRIRALPILMLGLLAAGASGVCAAPAGARPVWLCLPGQRPDPCTPGLSTTVYSPKFTARRVQRPLAPRHPAVDCFYVYPTVSRQRTGNATLAIAPEERAAALAQAGRYSQYCRVYAPMYRQVTLLGLTYTSTTPPDPALALSDVRAAFRTYLNRYNRARGFVLIGHSQGATVLRQLIARDVDPRPSVRRRLVSAILLGGNVLVRRGEDINGDFRHIPACHRATQTGCVIAFSTFDQPVPKFSIFGRPPVAGGTEVVLCTNPAALGGGSGVLDPIFPTNMTSSNTAAASLGVQPPTPPTVWWSVPRAYRARCSSADDAHVLQISPLAGAPTLQPTPSPAYGLHVVDANIALGNLIAIVRRQADQFVAAGRADGRGPVS